MLRKDYKMGREDLIKQLASSMGAPPEAKYAESRYDKGTGTFYCNGHVITPGKIDQALTYFEKSKNYVEPGSDVAIFCELAIEAINILRKDNTNAGTIVIK